MECLLPVKVGGSDFENRFGSFLLVLLFEDINILSSLPTTWLLTPPKNFQMFEIERKCTCDCKPVPAESWMLYVLSTVCVLLRNDEGLMLQRNFYGSLGLMVAHLQKTSKTPGVTCFVVSRL